MKRIAFFLYGTFCYLFFLGIFLYAVGFLGSFGVPNTIDGQPQVDRCAPIVILGLTRAHPEVMTT